MPIHSFPPPPPSTPQSFNSHNYKHRLNPFSLFLDIKSNFDPQVQKEIPPSICPHTYTEDYGDNEHRVCVDCGESILLEAWPFIEQAAGRGDGHQEESGGYDANTEPDEEHEEQGLECEGDDGDKGSDGNEGNDGDGGDNEDDKDAREGEVDE